jgi:hypothetical protein
VFLNKKVGMAAMQLTFEASPNYVDSFFVLSDCGKQVTIDLSSHSARVFGERQAKLNTIIQKLLQLENQITEYRASPEFKKAFK